MLRKCFLDAHSPALFALAESFELKTLDVVDVFAVSMVRFGRVLSLKLPTLKFITSINRRFQ
jgi:hypothetical protein